jgi:hypothetical protein
LDGGNPLHRGSFPNILPKKIHLKGNLVAEIKQSQAKTQQKIDQSVGKANKAL